MGSCGADDGDACQGKREVVAGMESGGCYYFKGGTDYCFSSYFR